MTGGRNTTVFVGALVLRLVAILALVSLPFIPAEPSTSSLRRRVVRDARRLGGRRHVAVVIFMLMAIPAERIFAKLATGATFKLQTDLSEHLQTLSLSFFDSRSIGELVSSVTNDIEAIARFFETAVSQIIRAIFQVLVIAVIMLIIDWRLAIAALLVVPVMLFITGVVQRLSTAGLRQDCRRRWATQRLLRGDHRRPQDDHRRPASGLGQGSQRGARRRRVRGRQPLVLPLAAAVPDHDGALDAADRHRRGRRWLLVTAGMAEVGVIVAFIGYAGLLASPLSRSPTSRARRSRPLPPASGYFALMAEQPALLDAPDAVRFEFKGGDVEFDDVDFSYVPGAPHPQAQQLRGRTRADDRHLRAHRRGQEHDHEHPDPLLRHRQRHDPHRRAGSGDADPGQPAPPGGHGAAGGLPLHRYGHEQPASTRARGRRRRSASTPPSRPTPTSSSPTCPRATTR